MADQLTATPTSARVGSRAGLGLGAGAYTIWGMFPAFFGLLSFTGAADILAHRVLWTLVLMVGVIIATRQIRALRGLSRRTWLLVAAGAVSISVNWGVYVIAVLTGHVAEAALGYFINPLLSVAFGVLFFRERLSRAAVVAIGLAVVAVVVLTVAYQRIPFIALSLAVSFALYGVVKKLTPLPPQVSLTAETITVAPFAVGYLGFVVVSHGQIADAPWQFVLLLLCGPMTAVPLLLFGAAAHRLPVVTIGVLQYLTPILQLLWAVAVRHEQLSATTWVGFALVWAALLVFTGDALWQFCTRNRKSTT
jgi:chloramphenicol-sensitive protein RarD